MSNLTTICIPAYNQEAFIGECIRSALEQSHPNLDILVVDDCSTDRTLEIARSFRDRRLTVLCNDSNLGLAGNWNRVVHLARGDYVKLLCGDDVLYPYCVERQVLALEQHPAAVMVCCARDVISWKGKKVLTRRACTDRDVIPGRAAVRRTIRAGTNIIGEPSGVVFRRSALLQAGAFDDGLPYMIDLDMWTRMLAFGDLAVVNAPLYAFRVSSRGLSTSIGWGQHKQWCAFVDRVRANPDLGVTRADAWRGKALSPLFMVARKAFYMTAGNSPKKTPVSV